MRWCRDGREPPGRDHGPATATAPAGRRGGGPAARAASAGARSLQLRVAVRSTATILAKSDTDGGDKTQNDLVGAELCFRALPGFLGGVSLKQMALWSFNGIDDGLTGRSVASLDFAPDLGIFRPTLAINAGGVYGKGVQDGFVVGPEIGFDVAPVARLQHRPEGCLRLPVPERGLGRGHPLGRPGSRHPLLICVAWWPSAADGRYARRRCQQWRPDDGPTALEVEGVSYGYTRSVKALDQVSFAVPGGPVHGAARAERRRQDHADGADHPAVLRRGGHASRSAATICAGAPRAALAAMGVVFQRPTLDLDLIGGAEPPLRRGAVRHGATRGTDRRGAGAAAASTDRAGSKVRTLSGGMKRRVEIGRALLHRPQLLVLDEPTVGLDIDSRRDIVEHVHALCREESLAVLWATHLIDEICAGRPRRPARIAARSAPPAPSPRWSQAAGAARPRRRLPAAHRRGWPPDGRPVVRPRSLRRRTSPNTSASLAPLQPQPPAAGPGRRRAGTGWSPSPGRSWSGWSARPGRAWPRPRRRAAPRCLVVRLDAQREAGVAQRVLVAAVDAGRVGQAPSACSSERHMVAASPSNSRPQPSANRVSPQNRASPSGNQ